MSSELHSADFPRAETVQDFIENVSAVRRRIAAAAERAGRNPDEIRLLPVSKTVPEDRLRLAYEVGCRMLGENKVQEAHRKAQKLADLHDLQWAAIGHLQRNKARYVARFASEFHALDRL